MARRSLSALLLTKRGVIVLLVASAGVLGAGFGYVFPALNDSPDVPRGAGVTTSGPTETTSDPATTSNGGTTATESHGETTTSSRGGVDGTTAVTSTTTTDAGGETSVDDADSSDRSDETNGDDPGPSNDDATVGIRAEANATVASLSSLTRAVVEG
jgi:hypothetical protein